MLLRSMAIDSAMRTFGSAYCGLYNGTCMSIMVVPVTSALCPGKSVWKVFRYAVGTAA